MSDVTDAYSYRVLSCFFRIDSEQGSTKVVSPSLRVVSLVFRGHDLLKTAKISINPQEEATLSVWKKLVPRESAGNGAWVLVNT